ncbi:extracellular solute-binding protein [Paenibacillus albiflavus]|uniref:Extracellular solute-binding protein n=1 Tax=Paenibacillus albiflavus TaxID=2545760 RepID=A0A4R4DZ26_9BACL|nr:extracellular solute-binding protein [Paenibacillus albiflavus]TCZ71059.1 extracellular solute-binding protein [Paenibacillus albiflavus]
MKGKKLISLALTAVMIAPLLTACSMGAKSEDKKERVLRIATSNGYTGDDEYFRQQFTDIFEFNNPNIKIEIIPTGDDSERYSYYGPRATNEPPKEFKDPFVKMQELMEGDNPPDIVMMNYDQMSALLEKNLLSPLDSKIAEDKFDTTDYVPAVYDGIKSLSSDGKTYALAPLFNSTALIYNKKIFTDAGVEPPTDNMTWDDMFALASRISKPEGNKPIYGFSFNTSRWSDPFYDMNTYTSPLGLRYLNETGDKMTVDSDDWERVWKKFVDLQQQKAMMPVMDPNNPDNFQSNPDEEGPFAYDLFMSGRLGMTVYNYYQIANLIDVNKHASDIKNYSPIDWDVVTLPSHPEHPGVVAGINIAGLMGINTKATNVEDAWKFIKFVNSPEWAKLKSNSSYQLPARKSYIKPKDGLDYHIEAFYNVKPSSFSENDYSKFYRTMPNIGMVMDAGRNRLQDVMLGKTSPREALKLWQEQGDKIIQEIKSNPNGPITIDVSPMK